MKILWQKKDAKEAKPNLFSTNNQQFFFALFWQDNWISHIEVFPAFQLRFLHDNKPLF